MDEVTPIVIVGAGPAGLTAAYFLSKAGKKVCVVDQKSRAGRKFLVAGHNGLNLTNNLELDAFLSKYPDEIIRKAVRQFPPQDFRTWFSELGIETYVGTSGKVFPIPSLKPIEVLNRWIQVLEAQDVSFYFNSKCIQVTEHDLILENKNTVQHLPYSHLIFATGGKSWKMTGSDGMWTKLFPTLNILPFQPSNAGFVLKQNQNYQKLEGLPLKNVVFYMENLQLKGEVVFTSKGLEGSPVYALNHLVRKGTQALYIDLKPTMTAEFIAGHLEKAKNPTTALKELKLGKAGLLLLKSLPKETFVNATFLAQHMKRFPLEVSGLYPLDRAISTVGGISILDLNENFQHQSLNRTFFIGEMVDWDAPTGGYLLQACFSMGFVAAKAILKAN